MKPAPVLSAVGRELGGAAEGDCAARERQRGSVVSRGARAFARWCVKNTTLRYAATLSCSSKTAGWVAHVCGDCIGS